MKIINAAVVMVAMASPALADGKEDTLTVIGMTIAKVECGLSPPDTAAAQRTTQTSMEFTGLTREQYVKSVGDMAEFKANEMYANRSIGSFCAKMALIYVGVNQ